MVVGRVGKASKGTGSGGWMVLPAVLAVLAIVVYPLAFATYYSFRKVLPNAAGEFVGFANYSGMARDPDFAEALRTTLLFTATSSALSFSLGLGLALLLSKPFRGRGAVAAAVVTSWVFPPVVAATFARLALFDGIGPLSKAAAAFGFGDGELLLLEPGVLLVAAVLVDVWRTTPFVALLLLAGMRTIPEDVYEAARIDGADALQRFLRITLPLLKPALLAVLLVRLLDAFRVFDLFRVMGDRSIDSLSTYVYQNVLLSQINFGLGNAAAVFVFLCAFSVSLFFVFVLGAQSPTGMAGSGLQAGAHDGTDGEDAGAAPTLRTAVGGLLAVLFLTPLAWVFWVSVTNLPGGSPTSQVAGPSLLSYPFVLFASPLALGLLNSAAIAGAAAALTMILACPAAYALGRFGLPHANGLLVVLLAVAFFPPVAVLVPLFVQLREVGLLGTHLGAVIPHAVFFLPFAIWLLATFFREIPSGVEDAARVDGAGRLRVLTAVILPLAAPSVFATGAFVFVLSWNELVFASTFTLNGPASPVTVVLADLVAQARTSSPGALAAGSIIAALPPMVLFLAFRRKVLAGLTGEALGRAARPADGARRLRSRASEKAVPWAATATFGLAGAWAAYLFAKHGLDALAFPYPLNYGEGPLLDQAARLAELRDIYPTEISEPPYAISNYPPLFVLFQAPFVWLFGPAFWYGRALSLVATAAVAALIALTLHSLTRDRAASAAAGLTFLAVPFVFHWSSLGRVDMPGLALSWAGLYALVRRPAGWRTVILASLLLVAAAYTRQTFALTAPLAAFVWLLALRRRREALALAALVGGLGLSLLAALSALSGGGFFLHTVIYNLNEFNWERVGSYLRAVQAIMPVLLVGGVTFLVLGLRSRDAAWWLVVSYLVGGTAVALTVGKVGSDVNYLLELSAALSLSAGALLARYALRSGVRSTILLALTLQVAIMVQSSQFLYAGFQDTSTSHRHDLARLEEIVDGSRKPVLADEYAGLLPLDGRRIYIQPFEFSQLAREGKWDQHPFVASIRDQSFGAILIFEPPGASGVVEERWTPEMLHAIEESYRPTETVADITVYRPR